MGRVVESRVKEQIKAAEMNCAGDFCGALDRKVEQIVSEAVARARSNDRKTVRSGDL